MKLSQFNFPLTVEQIAKYPAKFRDESRMLVLHKDTGEIEHKQFKDIINYMSAGILLYSTIQGFSRQGSMETRRRQVLRLRCSYSGNSTGNRGFGMCL